VTIPLTKKCKRCDFENSRDSVFCNRCGFALDDKRADQIVVTRARIDELLNSLTENPDKLERLLELVQK
ncbi:MAG: hypothetical protein HRF40_07460, partial [Nitrososphaera sp.]